MSHLKQISPILRVRNRTGLKAQPQSLEAIAPRFMLDAVSSKVLLISQVRPLVRKKESAPMLVFSSMSKRTRPSQVFRHSKGAGTVANAVDAAAVTHRRKSTP